MSDSSNAQKTALARNLEQFAQRKAEAAIDLLGQALPASVTAVVSSGIVKVKFELTNIPFTIPEITVPLLGSEYVRLPVQVGMKGFVIPGDAYLGGVSGLGGGTADLSPRPNLSNLVFAPIGNKNWTPPIDPNSTELYGPGGVILRDGNNVCNLRLTPTGIVVQINGVTVFAITAAAVIIPEGLQLGGTITSQTGSLYAGNIHTAGTITGDTDVVAGGVSGKTHEHGGVQTGSGNTGPPV